MRKILLTRYRQGTRYSQECWLLKEGDPLMVQKTTGEVVNLENDKLYDEDGTLIYEPGNGDLWTQLSRKGFVVLADDSGVFLVDARLIINIEEIE